MELNNKHFLNLFFPEFHHEPHFYLLLMFTDTLNAEIF